MLIMLSNYLAPAQRAPALLLQHSSREVRKTRRSQPLASASRTTSADSPPVNASVSHSTTTVPYSYLLPRQALALFAAGAALGPFCDGLHSQHDVLHYVSPTVSIQLDSLNWSFESCWWVPVLFGIAGLILGLSVPLLDELTTRTAPEQWHQHPQQPDQAAGTAATGAAVDPQQLRSHSSAPPPMGVAPASWPWTMLCICFFVGIYWLSGVLEQPLLGKTLGESTVPTLDVVLCAVALLHWVVFDCSPQGFVMSALTAVCGPALEVGLINLGGLYSYTHPVWFGAVPSWIPWVYFAGGPAVGNLGRMVWHTLWQQYRQTHAAQQRM